MSKVGIVTDSTNCLPAELVKQYGIRIAPAGLVVNGRVYQDQVDITPDEFWKLFNKAKEQPTTSAISPGVFASIFSDLAKTTDSIVCILVSKALSAIHQSAVQGRELVKAEHPELNIEIIDSKTSAGALGFIVLEAARAAEAGKSLSEIVTLVQDMVNRAKWVASLDTLKYLIRGGRAPKTAYVGELLHVKPLIGGVSGSGLVDSLGRTRGKRKAMVKLVELMKEHVDATKPVHVMVHYTDHIEDAEELKEMVTSQFNCTELYVTPYTPVMACHTGPVFALAFYS